MKENPSREWAAFAALSLAWGTSFLFIKIGVETLQPITLVALRLLFGLAGLYVIMRAMKLALPRGRTVWRHFLVVGLINVALPFTLITWAESGEQGIDSGLTAVLNSTVPLFSIVISGLLLRVERVTAGTVLGLLIGFAGIVWLVGPDVSGETTGLLPYLAVMVAALCYAAASAYARRYLTDLRPVVVATGQLVVAALLAVVLALVVENPAAQRLTWSALFAAVWLGLLGSCAAYLLYFYLLGRWGATRTTLVTYVIPVVGVTAGAIFLDEEVGWRLIAGGALILAGVAMVNLRPRRTWRLLRSARYDKHSA